MNNRKRYFVSRKTRVIRNLIRKLRISILALFVVIASISLLVGVMYIKKEDVVQQITPTPTLSPKPSPTVTPTPQRKRIVLLEVPFTSQAPFGEWRDPRQQDACEEASVLMSMYWVRNEKIVSKERAKQDILAMVKYQEDTFGEYRDTSTKDTANRLLKGYGNYTNFTIKDITDAEDIIAELDEGNLAIVPLNGQLLGNMSFTQPGPTRHMLVIKGYNRQTQQFITNDPGVRQGENWNYGKNVLFNAIRDYETGYHVPIAEIKKVMIVVKLP